MRQTALNLLKEFNDLNEFKNSDELKDFLSLSKYFESKEYQSLHSSIETDKKKEIDKIKQFEAQKKSKVFRNYFKFKESPKYKDHQTFLFSKELKEFEDLEKLVTSKKFEEEKRNFENQKSAEAKKTGEFNSLKKAKAIKSFLNSSNSENKKTVDQLAGNPEVKKFLELETYINSSVHRDKLATAAKNLATITDQLMDYQQKKKSRRIKDFYRFQNSTKFKSFQAFEKSKDLSDYLSLEKYLLSETHKNLLKSIEEKEKAESEKRNTHAAFKNSKKYKWYLELKDSKKFDELKKWELVFEDDFNDSQLDRKKWMTRYFWGDKLINDAYAFETDKAFPTDGKNIELGNSHLKIVTRNEKVNGKMWKPPFGFIPSDFNYTTGLISTARLAQAKIR